MMCGVVFVVVVVVVCGCCGFGEVYTCIGVWSEMVISGMVGVCYC